MSVPKHPRPRIEALSDLIFGLALSIGTISLISRLPRTPIAILVDLMQFGFSFLILISVWMSYTSIMSVLPIEYRRTMVLNIIMLFLVSIEPYLFYLNVVFDLSDFAVLLDTASIIYALDLAGSMAILALFTNELTIEERKLLPQDILGRYRGIRNSFFFSAAIFAITIVPVFWVWRVDNTPVRFYLWFLPLILGSLRRVSRRQTHDT